MDFAWSTELCTDTDGTKSVQTFRNAVFLTTVVDRKTGAACVCALRTKDRRALDMIDSLAVTDRRTLVAMLTSDGVVDEDALKNGAGVAWLRAALTAWYVDGRPRECNGLYMEDDILRGSSTGDALAASAAHGADNERVRKVESINMHVFIQMQ